MGWEATSLFDMNGEKRNNRRQGGTTVWDEKRALEVLSSACAKCEQCEYDLRVKMSRHNVDSHTADRVIDYLTEHNFLNEKRFASAYARDKVRFNGWGRQKITLMLRAKRIPGYIIEEGLADIDEATYSDVLHRLVKSGTRSLNLDEYADRLKLMRKLYARGFETDLIQDAIADIRRAAPEE